MVWHAQLFMLQCATTYVACASICHILQQICCCTHDIMTYVSSAFDVVVLRHADAVNIKLHAFTGSQCLLPQMCVHTAVKSSSVYAYQHHTRY
jgi:hypothetical protein